ncbi:MAG: ATP-grasp domain-containing protein [Burkholderiales bacterium]
MPKSPLLIISASGRALAASAARAGLSCVVLDLFNDLDTRAIAAASRACATRSGRFHGAGLLNAARALQPGEGYEACVIGSGFEGRPALLRALARELPYLGNTPECIEQIKDPQRFFSMLDALGIGHPEVRFTPPPSLPGWLSKRIGGAGGGHVRRAELGWPRRERRYFQRYQGGRLMSALFLADGKRAVIAGCSEQWCQPLSRLAPFAYGGAVSLDEIPGELPRIATDLARTLALRGLNGLDFIVEEGCVHVIELNPRPTATLDLHDERVEGGLLCAHIAACRGELPASLQPMSGQSAHAILWSQGPWQVPALLQWPAWVTDIPPSGTPVPARRPVCSVHARAATSAAARRKVHERLQSLSSMLWPMAA